MTFKQNVDQGQNINVLKLSVIWHLCLQRNNMKKEETLLERWRIHWDVAEYHPNSWVLFGNNYPNLWYSYISSKKQFLMWRNLVEIRPFPKNNDCVWSFLLPVDRVEQLSSSNWKYFSNELIYSFSYLVHSLNNSLILVDKRKFISKTEAFSFAVCSRSTSIN